MSKDERNNDERLWVVGRDLGGGKWELVGIFGDEEEAGDVCCGVEYFIGPVNKGVAYMGEGMKWEGKYYYIKR